MLEGHRRLLLTTTENDPVEIEVNFSKNPAIDNCQILRITKGKETFDVPRDALVSILMMVGSEGNQKNLMPIKFGTVRKIERLLGFEWVCSRDFKKGEKVLIQAPWVDEIPTEEEMMSGNLKRKTKYGDGKNPTHKNSFLLAK